MGTTTLYITRHGQTEWNVQQRMQGQMDSPLTELGVRQAEWLGRAMRDKSIDAVYSSSSPRAIRTAEIIRGERAVPVVPCDDFKELGLGTWEGGVTAELESSHPEQYQYFWKNPARFAVEGSETFAGAQQRALVKLMDIVRQHEGQTLLVVTHTVIIKVLMAYFEGRVMEKLWDLPYIHPTCLCRVDITDGTAEIVLHGDISHYETDASETNS
ncbi:histidine phosphatase family protein ['Paenibacillus yunnanensis' Narsing Rao et al. 2020]|uniref:histidine phosphatase family protein n=1 Tax=Paenibacillus tengchongensis TaxID=2608684 RepID=UPI00124E6D4B|nr:histidine phosphatase family protein [Paenibacillus tengchongensis]